MSVESLSGASPFSRLPCRRPRATFCTVGWRIGNLLLGLQTAGARACPSACDGGMRAGLRCARCSRLSHSRVTPDTVLRLLQVLVFPDYIFQLGNFVSTIIPVVAPGF